MEVDRYIGRENGKKGMRSKQEEESRGESLSYNQVFVLG
jgi:hypothetical protein